MSAVNKTEMEALIEQIGAGAPVADQGLMKGLKDGFNKLLALTKAKEPPPKPDDKDDEEDDEDEAPDGPGYQNLGKGRPAAPPAPPTPNALEAVDGTELLMALHKSRTEDAKELKALKKAVKRLQAQADDNARAQAEAQVSLFAPMAKALGDLHLLIKAIPAKTADDQASINARGLEKLLDKPPGGATAIPMETLVKARFGGVLSEDHLRLYKKTGKFHPDEAQNARITASVTGAAQS